MLPSVVSGVMQYGEAEDYRQYAEQNAAKIKKLIEGIQSPEQIDFSQFTPQDFKVAAQYSPQVAAFVQERAPQLIEVNSAEGQEGLSAQRQVLQEMLQKSRGGMDPLAEIERQQAQRQAGDFSKSQLASIQDQMAQRGMGMDSGLALAMKLGANANSADRLAQTGLQAAADRSNQRNNASMQAAGLGGQLYGQASDLASRNVGILNAHNERAVNSANEYGRYAAGMGNEAQKYNIGNTQDIMNKNADMQNQYGWQKLQQGQAQADQRYGHQVGQAQRQAGVYDTMNTVRGNAATGKNAAYQGIGDAASKGLMAGAQYFGGAPTTPALDAEKEKNKFKSPYGA